MRHRLGLVAALLVLSGCGADLVQHAGAAPRRVAAPLYTPVALLDAVGAGQVEAEFRSTGRASGPSVLVRVTNRSATPLEIVLDRGTVLTGTTPGVQTMVVDRVLGTSMDDGHIAVDTDRILLDAGASREYVLSAYCLDWTLPHPPFDGRLSVTGRHADAQRVLDAARAAGGASQIAIQLAIWSVTNDITAADVEGRLTFTADDLARARQLLQAAGLDPAGRRLLG